MIPYTAEQIALIKKIIPKAERYAYKMTEDRYEPYTWNQYFHAYLDAHFQRVKINPQPTARYS